MIFDKVRQKSNFNLKIKWNGLKLYPCKSIKYLGVYLDPSLSGEAHCKVLATRLRRANGLLSKIRHYVPRNELIPLYHALFSSHLTYGAQIWGQQEKKHTKVITKLQNRALRILNFQDLRADSSPLYANDKILKLKDLIKVKNILFIHDYLNKSLPSCFQNDFTKLDDIYTSIGTRNASSGCLNVPKQNSTTYGNFSIVHRSISAWNDFTKLFKSNLAHKSRIKLKTRLEEYFLQQY